MNRTKRLDYTLIAEGYAEYGFIPAYLRLVAEKYSVQAVPSSLGFKRQIAGKSKVLKEAEIITITAIQRDHPLIIVGIDLDAADHDPEQPKHANECQQVIKALGKTYKKYGDRIIYFVTVQAIEQWLTYQAYKVGLAEKANSNSLESKTQDELKKILYGTKDNGPNMDRIAQNIAENGDFDELAKQSRSFAHFHKRITEFLANYQ
ncbi:hypothetical protein GCM10027592_06260 [Spirosoma flavus]